MNIAILVAVLAEYDAVGTDACEMGIALQRLGHEVRFFATATRGNVPGTTSPDAIDAFVGRDGLLIYHFAFGWPPGVDVLRRLRCRRIVRYHNITPAEFFENWSVEYEASCRAGRDEIGTIAEVGCELYLCASPFNADDFLRIGVSPTRVAVLPPFNRLERLISIPANLDLLDAWQGAGANWLAIGRLAPNKGHFELLDAFKTYLDHCEGDARLLVVGSSDVRLSRYAEAIHARIRVLDLGAHVQFLQDLDEAGLKAAYLRADALVALSAHEGFGVPLVEAMALGVPVIALDRGAQAWTIGPAGLIWDDPDPAPVAASMERLRNDGRLRSELRERGFERVACEFAPAVLEARLASVVEAL